MELTKEECFALEKLFCGDSKFEKAVVGQLDSAEVVERQSTGVGYFSTIKFAKPLPDHSGRMQWDWNFTHPDLGMGGSFIGCYEPPDTIELEAVVHDGLWPSNFDPHVFVES